MRRIRPLIDLLSEDHSEAEENGKHRLLARAVVTAGSAPEGSTISYRTCGFSKVRRGRAALLLTGEGQLRGRVQDG